MNDLSTLIEDDNVMPNAFAATLNDASAIIPGTSYVHHHEFWAWKHNDINNDFDRLNHAGQIGTDFCIISAQFCTFSVDTTLIHKRIKYIPMSN